MHIRRPRRAMSSLILVSTAGGLIEAIILVLVVRVAVNITEPTPDQTVAMPILGVYLSLRQALGLSGVLVSVLLLADIVAARMASSLSTEVLESTRARIVSAYLSATWSVQSQEREGSLQETISTLANLSSALALNLIHGATAFISLMVLLSAALVVDPIVMGSVSAIGVLLFVLLRPLSVLTARSGTRFVEVNTDFVERVSGIAMVSKEIRLFGVAPRVIQELKDDNRRVSDSQRRTRLLSRVGFSLFRDLAYGLLIGGVGLLAAAGSSRVAGVGAVVLLVVRSLSSASTVQGQIHVVAEQAPNLLTLNKRLAHLESAFERTGSVQLARLGDVEFRGVGYLYEGGVEALKDINVTLAQGSVVGVVGRSGSGKSTLIELLLRLREPSFGQIRVGGIPLEDVDAPSWSRLVALVPQEPNLMSATISENIRFLRSGISQSDIEGAAFAAHVGDEILELDSGFETVLGPRGSGLSGGQKQRVAIARALVGRPQLLVLDEPTSALDSESERRFQRTMEGLRGSITIVIVAHRLSTLDICDRIISLDRGRVSREFTVGVEEGGGVDWRTSVSQGWLHNSELVGPPWPPPAGLA